MKKKTVLITGASGYIGSQLVQTLAQLKDKFQDIVAVDIRPEPDELKLPLVTYYQADIRKPALIDIFKRYQVDTVVHLACIVSPGNNRKFEYSVDVGGTYNILQCSLKSNVSKFIITSSGAAYGYHADNPRWLKESDPLRGNPEFPYSDHKRLVEELLADYRDKHPELKQLIFRPGAVFGKTVSNRITKLFEQPVVMGIKGSDSPFNFIWDQDVVQCLVEGVISDKEGVYNLAGDGALTMKDLAKILKKPYVEVSPNLLSGSLDKLHQWGITKYGPEQMMFLQYRPVLANQKLKDEFGYIPQKTSEEVFLYYLDNRKK